MSGTIETGLRMFFVCLFLASSIAKASDIGAFAEGVRAYRLVPPRLVSSAAIAVTIAEFGAVGALVARPDRGWVLALVLLGAFQVAVLRGFLLRERIACHCLNATETLDVGSVIRGLWFLLTAAIGLLLMRAPLPGTTAGIVGAAIVAVIAATGAVWTKGSVAVSDMRRTAGSG